MRIEAPVASEHRRSTARHYDLIRPPDGDDVDRKLEPCSLPAD